MKKKREARRTRAFSLMEVLVGVFAGTIVLAGAIMAFKQAVKFQKAASTNTQNDQSLGNIALFLKSKLSGYHNLTNLSFQVPVTRDSLAVAPNAPLEVQSSGFFVEQDKDYYGNSSPCNDRLWAISEVPLSARVELNGGADPSSTQIVLRSVGTGTPPTPDQFFANGDLMALNNGTSTELIYVQGNLTSSTTYTFAAHTFDYTFIPVGAHTTITQTYVDGDQVSKVKLLQIGVDPTTQTLNYSDGSTTSKVGQGVTGFAVLYNLIAGGDCSTAPNTQTFNPGKNASNVACPWTVPAGTLPFDRTQWATLTDASFGYSCYNRIQKFQVQYQTNGTLGFSDFTVNK